MTDDGPNPLRGLILAIAVGIVLVACGTGSEGPDLVIDEAVVRLPAGANSAMYFSITNRGAESDRLLGVSVNFATAELHESTMADGLMTMSPVGSIEIPGGKTVLLESGGFHVMLIDVSPLEVGRVVGADLLFEKSGTIHIEVPVREYGDD
jgi:copper(I)-binding protein